jgi:2-oxoglutarate dehydrogenase E1 component
VPQTTVKSVGVTKGEEALYAGSAELLEGLYRQFRTDPHSVPLEWRAYFGGLERFAPGPGEAPPPVVDAAQPAGAKQVGVLQLINAYRFRGHKRAQLDPLALYERPEVPDLSLEYHGLSEQDLDTVFNTGSLVAPEYAPLREVVSILEATYCRTVGAEYMHIAETAQKRWLQARLEGPRGTAELTTPGRIQLLERLTAAAGFEEYLHSRYVGQKRFSLEGAESLIPLLDELVQSAGAQGVREVVIGMAHRGRLNVLVNVLGKRPRDLFFEFEGKGNGEENGGSGDVKYHQGFSSDIDTPGGPVHVALAFNPSHLEIINPVVEGSVRSRQEKRRDRERNQVLPVLIHGDAAISGQGVVMETLNLSQTRGYATGGTVHLVVNNQIGFTTSDPLDARSTLYCTDVAKTILAPVFHVNADDPEAVIFATRLALDYRMTFNKDVFIDLVCYRRQGHNEADEPAVTQPLMYQRIRRHPSVRLVYRDALVARGALREAQAEQMLADYLTRLEGGEVVARPVLSNFKSTYAANWARYTGGHWDEPAATAVARTDLARLLGELTILPDGFVAHPAVRKMLDARRRMAAGQQALDWGAGETLAYATLLENGYPVRLSGQDSGRGTFFHRHAVLHNQVDGARHVPLQHLAEDQPQFLVIDSILSEEAVLAFELGYSAADPETLVIWEAQFGDFANNAQVVIDQFISSSEAKWKRLSGLVLFLPHGYDGQGPEHSSARLERYLQLCAEDNMQVVYPSTPAQMFHMLRRQMLRTWRRPLVVMTPKSLLRHRLSVSALEELSSGGFQPVIDEVDPLEAGGVGQVLLCSGKVYFDLLEARREQGRQDVAILRLEQLYPFPEAALAAALARYGRARLVRWVQEEPLNQGAWLYIQPLLRRHVPEPHTLECASRPPSASPAVGYLHRHMEQQRRLVEDALARPPTATRGRLRA